MIFINLLKIKYVLIVFLIPTIFLGLFSAIFKLKNLELFSVILTISYLCFSGFLEKLYKKKIIQDNNINMLWKWVWKKISFGKISFFVLAIFVFNFFYDLFIYLFYGYIP